ncbi:MAG TPA: DUF1810 domain-containing protein [Sphingomicrobium sp.]|nr:DUF1810 domain-containing protein [Sphingomicrobium sp.]
MSDPHHLQRFLDAQEDWFEIALGELKAGSKRSHWMWFIFPQLAALGRSPTAKFYGIASITEARAYLDHPILGVRLRHSVEALLPYAGQRMPEQILGPVDALKLKSCLTLFDVIRPGDIFDRALAGFYGERDARTLALLNRQD